jgi:hypothetical protein
MAALQSCFETTAGAFAQKAYIRIQIVEFSQSIKQAYRMSCRVLAAAFLMDKQLTQNTGPKIVGRHDWRTPLKNTQRQPEQTGSESDREIETVRQIPALLVWQVRCCQKRWNWAAVPPGKNLHGASITGVTGMAGYHEWLAGYLLITILINGAEIVNLMRIIFIWHAAEFVRRPDIRIEFGLPTPFRLRPNT